MKLYICWGTFRSPRPGGHPCGNAHKALVEAGHNPELVKCYGWKVLPGIFNQTAGRKRVRELTGDISVPVLELDSGETVQGSDEIVAWAGASAPS